MCTDTIFWKFSVYLVYDALCSVCSCVYMQYVCLHSYTYVSCTEDSLQGAGSLCSMWAPGINKHLQLLNHLTIPLAQSLRTRILFMSGFQKFSKTLKRFGDDYSRIYIFFKCRFPVTCVRLLGYSSLISFTPPGGCRSLCSPKFLLGWQT